MLTCTTNTRRWKDRSVGLVSMLMALMACPTDTVNATDELFPGDDLRVEVSEGATSGALVADLSQVLHQRDSFWELESTSDSSGLRLEATTGQLCLSSEAALDHETRPVLRLHVRRVSLSGGVDDALRRFAVDAIASGATAADLSRRFGAAETVKIALHVLDVPEPPRFSPVFRERVLLTAPGLAGAVWLRASDPDVADALTWSIPSGDEEGCFLIEEATGRLMLRQPPNLQKSPASWNTQISERATDSTGLSAERRISVTVSADALAEASLRRWLPTGAATRGFESSVASSTDDSDSQRIATPGVGTLAGESVTVAADVHPAVTRVETDLHGVAPVDDNARAIVEPVSGDPGKSASTARIERATSPLPLTGESSATAMAHSDFSGLTQAAWRILKWSLAVVACLVAVALLRPLLRRRSLASHPEGAVSPSDPTFAAEASRSTEESPGPAGSPLVERRQVLRGDDLRAMKAALLARNPNRTDIPDEFPERRSSMRTSDLAAFRELSKSAHQFNLAQAARQKFVKQWHLTALCVTTASLIVAVVTFLGIGRSFAWEGSIIASVLGLSLLAAVIAFQRMRKVSSRVETATASIRDAATV